MKRMKKLISLIAAVVMVLTMTVSAAAAEGDPAPAAGSTYDLTINVSDSSSAHKFVAYQIFGGSVNIDAGGRVTIANVVWGTGVTRGETLYSDIQGITLTDGMQPFKQCGSDAEATAEILSNGDDDSELVHAFSEKVQNHVNESAGKQATLQTDGSYLITGLSAGYYLVLDTATEQAGLVPSAILVRLIGKNMTIDAKIDVASVAKSALGETYDVGSDAEYKLVGTLPASFKNDTNNIGGYEYSFTDTFEDSLKQGSDWGLGNEDNNGNKTVVSGITIMLRNENEDKDITTSFSKTWNANTQTLTVSTSKLRDISGVTKDSKIIVNYKAKVDKKPENTAKINNEVYLTYGEVGNTRAVSNAEHQTATVIETVFTLELVVNKVNGKDTTESLKGAEFLLSKTLSEQETGGPKPKTVFLKVNEESGAISWVEQEAATKLTTGEDGKLNVKGIAAGDYELTETKAPDGYNKLEKPIPVKITAVVGPSSSGGKELTNLSVFTEDDKPGKADKDKGVVTISIANNKGIPLPSTGGMGLTIIYAVGAVLLVGAGILLVTRRRMKTK